MSSLLGRPALAGRHLVGRALLLLTAIVLSAAPASQLLAGSSWLLLTVATAAPVILSGILLRRLLRHQVLVPLAQAAVIVVLVLGVESAHGLTQLQDGPLGVLRDQLVIFPAAVSELAGGLAPLTLGARGTVLVVLLISLLALALDVLYLELGWHTPTALVLTASLLLPALQQPAGGPWWNVVAPVLAGALILATRTVHADPRHLHGDRRPQAGPAARPGRALAATALCVALVAGLAAPLAGALPELAPPRIALDIDLLYRLQSREGPTLGPVMIDDDVSVRRSLLEQDDTEVLRYTTTAQSPSYLRLRALNAFDGEAFRSDVEAEEPIGGVGAFSDARDDGESLRADPADFIDTDVRVTDFAGDRLPVPDNVREVRGADPRLELTVQPSNGEIALNGASAVLSGQRYTVASEPSTATADELRGVDPAVFEVPFRIGYTSREEVPEAAAQLAEELAADADTAFDTAVAFQDYFRGSFAYSLTVTSPPGEDPLESFLADRIGYCEQFASAFALMMTSQGYPARVVIGFTPGELDGEQWTVSAKNAHAWPEVWFGPEHGWVRFEPTPAAAANGVRQPGVTAEGAGQEEVGVPAPEVTDVPTAEIPSSDEDPAADDAAAAAAASDSGGDRGSGPISLSRVQRGVLTALLAGALLAAGAAVAVVRVRRARARARDERWAAVLGGSAGEDGGGGAGGGGGPSAGAAPVATALDAERGRRRAGELAWSELTHELTARERAIRWLGVTGAWGRPPTRIALDPALPPARALEDLLDQIDAGEVEVTAEHRAAAGRIAAAFTAARYAAPLAEAEPERAEAGGGARPQHPLREDSNLVGELVRTAR